MNVRDSEVVCGLLEKEGYKIVAHPEKAEIILFNTCSVRQHAEEKVWSEIGRMAKMGTVPKKRGQSPFLIGVIGCMAQNYKEEIFKKAAAVDFIVGPQDLHKIPDILKKFQNKKLFEFKAWETDGQLRPQDIYHTGFYQDKNHAYVVISEGCSNFCSYCVVPYVRGGLRHRDYRDILKEIEKALDKRITRITLLGQNVNAYKYDDIGFPGLIKSVNALKGLEEFSFVTSHPKDTSVELFKTMAGLDKLKKHLHLPLQSGSDRILKAMNRGYTRKFYLDLADNYRRIVKGGALTTDIIVGFPSESQKDFQDTYGLVEDARFNAAYIFKYSVRPHTEAAKLPDDVERKDKERRHRLMLELQRGISKSKRC